MELHQNLAARPTWAEPGPLPFAEGRRTSPLQQPFPTSLTIPSLAEPDPMALISGLLPPSRENWQLLTWLWQFFPLVSLHLCYNPHSVLSLISHFGIAAIIDINEGS